MVGIQFEELANSLTGTKMSLTIQPMLDHEWLVTKNPIQKAEWQRWVRRRQHGESHFSRGVT
jgi:hypothetical protein